LPVPSFLEGESRAATIARTIWSGSRYGKMNAMITTLTIDRAGRLVLPKPVREELQLSAGDSLELGSSEDQIVLRPVRGAATMRKKEDVWVMRTGKPLSAEVVNQTIRKIRNERGRVDASSLRPSRRRSEKNHLKWFFDTSVLIPAFV
jgi:AbrB family looped-hinge helix DNA binding protein